MMIHSISVLDHPTTQFLDSLTPDDVATSQSNKDVCINIIKHIILHVES